MSPSDSVKRVVNRASGEPHFGGVLGEGVLGLSQAAQNQALKEVGPEDCVNRMSLEKSSL
jgi:hypothetical protein